VNDDSHRGPVPTPIADAPSSAIALELGTTDVKSALIKHLKDDAVQFGSLRNMRFYARGILALLSLILVLGMAWGPWFFKLGIKDVVEPIIQERSRDDREYIGARLDSFKASVDEAAQRQAERLDKLEERRAR
jgi:hypothetical protein